MLMDLETRNRDHATEIFILIGEREAYALAAGFLPSSVKSQARAAVDWEFKHARAKRRRR